MAGAFLYLTFCSARNRMRQRLRRLREPRYLVGLVAGLAYFYFFLFRTGGRTGRRVAFAGGASLLSLWAAPAEVFGSLALFIIAAVAWATPGVGQPVEFSRAEVQFLFPAPVTRRELLHYKLLRSQLGLVLSSVIFALLMRPSSVGQGWMTSLGLWLMLMVVSLHLTGVSLSRASLAQHGRSGVGRQWLPLIVVIGSAGILGETLFRNWATLAAAIEAGDGFLDALMRMATTGAAGVVLWPFRALVCLPLAPTPAAFWQALMPVLVIIALNYMWVLRSDAAFEEAAAAHAEKRAADRHAPKPVVRGSTATPFRLAIEGPPETAVLWKNLILLGRYVSVRTLLRLLPLVIAFGIIARGGGRATTTANVMAVLCLPISGLLLLMGPQIMRNDLRQDLGNLALLKTWPVRGAALIRGEVLAPTLVMSVLIWLLFAAAAVLSGGIVPDPGVAATVMDHKWSVVAAAAIVAPAILLSQTVLLNGVAVLFPAWSAIGASRSRGIAAMGQRMVMLGGILLTLLVSLVPGAVVGGAVMFAVYYFTSTLLIVLPAAVLCAFVVAECWIATEVFGRVLDRTDVSAIDAVE